MGLFCNPREISHNCKKKILNSGPSSLPQQVSSRKVWTKVLILKPLMCFFELYVHHLHASNVRTLVWILLGFRVESTYCLPYFCIILTICLV